MKKAIFWLKICGGMFTLMAAITFVQALYIRDIIPLTHTIGINVLMFVGYLLRSFSNIIRSIENDDI